MVKILLGLFSICLVISTLRCEAPKEEDGILVLTKDNFDEAIKSHKYILVEFYAPWCGHCKKLAPEYVKLAGELKAENSEIRLAKIDATEETDVSERFEISGYPTLKLFIDKEPVDFEGGRTAEEILLWLKKKSGPPALPVSSVSELNKLREANKVIVLGLFKSADSFEAKSFLNVAKYNDDIPFAISHEQAIFDELTVTQDTVVLLKKFDEGRNDFGRWETELKAFIEDKQRPNVWDFSPDSTSKIFRSEVKVFVFFFASKTSAKFEEQINEFKKAAANFRGKALFVHLDIDDLKTGERMMNLAGADAKNAPEVTIIQFDNRKMKKYKPRDKEIKAASIYSFVDDFLNNKVPRFYPSQELPEDWDANPVKVIVGGNFKQVALDRTKTVLVEFYAPWCGACKQLAPVYEELGQKFVGRTDEFIIAKMDATKNEIEEVEIKSFPTLKLFPKNSDEIIDYTGERTVEALTKFVESLGKIIEKPKDEL